MQILPYATTWMKLEDTVPSKINKVQRDKYYTNPLIWRPKTVTVIDAESRVVGSGVREGGRGVGSMGTQLGRWTSPGVYGGDGCTTMWMYGTLLYCTLKNGENYLFYNNWKKRIPGTENWVWCRVWGKKRGAEKVYSCVFHLFLLSVPRLWLWKARVLKQKISMKLRELI